MEKNKLLIVDDSAVERGILSRIFKDDYAILQAKDGKEALDLTFANFDSLVMILLDIVMPVMDGFKVLEHLRELRLLNKVPVVIITSESSASMEIKALRMGASDIIIKPFSSYVVKQRVKNIIELYRHKIDLEDMVRRQTKKIKETNELVVDSLSTIIEYRSLESGLHIKRIRVYTRTLLESMALVYKEFKLTPETINAIASASSMHDIGKIAIPDSILLKPGKLTKSEYEIMKSHTLKGCDILRSFRHMNDKEYLRLGYKICRHHHERWDGNGYPDGLKGDEIPLCAQAVSIADVYDALTNDRVYKPAYSHEQAVKMIVEGECGIFSPKLLDCFLRVEARFRYLAQKMNDSAQPRVVREDEHLSEAETEFNADYYVKYITAIKYSNANVMEVDLDRGTFIRVHVMDDDFERYSGSGDYSSYLSALIENDVHPDDRAALINACGLKNMAAAFDSGRDRTICSFRKLNARTKTYQWFSTRALRMDVGVSSQHKAIIFTKNIDKQMEAYLSENTAIKNIVLGLRNAFIEIYQNNLTADTFIKLQDFEEGEDVSEARGCYSECIQYDMENLIYPEDQPEFARCFLLPNLVAAFDAGQTEVSLKSRRIGDDGRYHWTEMIMIKIEDGTAGDMIALGLLKSVDGGEDALNVGMA